VNDWPELIDDVGKAAVRFAVVLACLIFAAGFCLGFLTGRFG
jgi:hypothetical protein